MQRRAPRGVLVAVPAMSALLVLLLGVGIGAEPWAAPLLRQAGLTTGDLEDLARGKVVARVLNAKDNSEILAVGAVRLRAPLQAVAAYLLDPQGPAAAGQALRSGPLDPAGIAGLRLDSRDAAELRECRVGECDFRLSREAIERLQSVGWEEPAALPDGSRALRELLLEYAEDYWSRGDAALMHYNDEPVPVSIGASLERLLPRFDALNELALELAGHLRDFPHGMPGVRNVVYWQRERFWRKEVVSLNHRALLRKQDRVLAATKQLWANHYYESSLSLAAAFEDSDGVGFVVVNHTRADIRPGGFNFVERALVRRLVRGRLRDQLWDLRRYMEQVTPPAPPLEAVSASR